MVILGPWNSVCPAGSSSDSSPGPSRGARRRAHGPRLPPQHRRRGRRRRHRWLARSQMGFAGQRLDRDDRGGRPRLAARPPGPQRARTRLRHGAGGPRCRVRSATATIAHDGLPARRRPADRTASPYSPGLEGVIAGETSLSSSTASAAACCIAATASATSSRRGRTPPSPTCCGPANGIRRGSRPPPSRRRCSRCSARCRRHQAHGRVRTAVSAWGATQDLPGHRPSSRHAPWWPPRPPPSPRSPGYAPARSRSNPTRRWTSSRASCTSSPARARRRHRPRPRCVFHRRRRTRVQRLDVHGTGHHLDPVRHRVGRRGAIGTMKGPLHGGAPSEVVDQLHRSARPSARSVGPRGTRPGRR